MSPRKSGGALTVAEAGWYADPADPARVRWWDGAAWTDHVQQEEQTPVPTGISLEPIVPTAPSLGSVTAPTVGATTATLERTAVPAATSAEPDPAAVPDPPFAERPAGTHRPTAGHHPATTPTTGPAPLISWDSQGPSAAAPTRPGAGAAGFGSTTVTSRSDGTGRGFPWVRTVVVLILLGAIGAGVVLIGLPVYRAQTAAAAAGELAPLLAQSPPAKLGGQKAQVRRAAEATSLAGAIRADGAPWAWAAVYGNRSDTSIYLAAELPADSRALAMQAQTDPAKAAELLGLVGTGMIAGAGGQLGVGAATEYGTEVGGKAWCRPITLGGVGGGHCLWTNGREVLQLVNFPSIEALAAKHTLSALQQLDTTR